MIFGRVRLRLLVVMKADYLTSGGWNEVLLMMEIKLMSPRWVSNVRVYRIVVAHRRMEHEYVQLTTVCDLEVGQFVVLCYRYRE
jgi:hypothetical protein